MDKQKLECPFCNQSPGEISEIVHHASQEAMTPEQFAKTDGTYSAQHNLFCCTSCYVKIGTPSVKELAIAYGYYRTHQALGTREVF